MIAHIRKNFVEYYFLAVVVSGVLLIVPNPNKLMFAIATINVVVWSAVFLILEVKERWRREKTR